MFCLDDYDCIGFDLDNTLAEYNVSALMELEYGVLAKFLIEQKGYDSELLSKPYKDGEHFLQKGLFMDLKKGNIVKVGQDGKVLKCCHGTRQMSDDEVIKAYGSDKIWQDAKSYIEDPLSAWNTPLEKRIRSVMDSFDTPGILIFARIIDTIDKKAGKEVEEYDVWPDILEGLYAMYERSNFAKGTGGFFSNLIQNPDSYYKKCSEKTLAWLKELRKIKFLVLITGSHIDFASFTASTCLGPDWKDYFDAVICYARKPLFFITERPFLKLSGVTETVSVSLNEIENNFCLSQGNWKDLIKFVGMKRKVQDPKSLYIGDNLIQDIYTPVKYKCCDAVAVSSELNRDSNKFWGSYFDREDGTDTFWNYIIKTHAKICVSDLSVFANKKTSFQFVSFKGGDGNDGGYYSQ